MPFMFGIPGETYADALKTIDFAIELDPDLANFHALTAFPGTDLYDHHAQYGTLSHELGDYTYQGAAFVPYTMTREEIHALRQLGLRRFYSRPAFLLRQLLRLRNVNDLLAALAGLRSLASLWARRGLFRRRPHPDAPAPAAAAATPRRAPGSSAG